jgi:hypothetical protein
VPLCMHETVCGPLGLSPWNLVWVNWLKLFDTCCGSLKYGVMNFFDVKDVLNKSWKKKWQALYSQCAFLYLCGFWNN